MFGVSRLDQLALKCVLLINQFGSFHPSITTHAWVPFTSKVVITSPCECGHINGTKIDPLQATAIEPPTDFFTVSPSHVLPLSLNFSL